MEDGLVRGEEEASEGVTYVLILVVVEDGLVLMISTSKGLTHAKKIAKKRFQMYGYKGRAIVIHPFSVSNSKPIAI